MPASGIAGIRFTHASATPAQINNTPTHRVTLNRSLSRNFAPHAPVTYAKDVAGTTKLTGYHESIVRKEKNDTAISRIPTHSQASPKARPTTRKTPTAKQPAPPPIRSR